MVKEVIRSFGKRTASISTNMNPTVPHPQLRIGAEVGRPGDQIDFY